MFLFRVSYVSHIRRRTPRSNRVARVATRERVWARAVASLRAGTATRRTSRRRRSNGGRLEGVGIIARKGELAIATWWEPRGACAAESCELLSVSVGSPRQLVVLLMCKLTSSLWSTNIHYFTFFPRASCQRRENRSNTIHGFLRQERNGRHVNTPPWRNDRGRKHRLVARSLFRLRKRSGSLSVNRERATRFLAAYLDAKSDEFCGVLSWRAIWLLVTRTITTGLQSFGKRIRYIRRFFAPSSRSIQ